MSFANGPRITSDKTLHFLNFFQNVYYFVPFSLHQVMTPYAHLEYQLHPGLNEIMIWDFHELVPVTSKHSQSLCQNFQFSCYSPSMVESEEHFPIVV